MTDYVVTNGKASTYPSKHYGGHFIGNRATFCTEEDFASLDSNVLAIPNLPITTLSATPVRVLPNFFGLHVKQRAHDSIVDVSFKTVRSHDNADGKFRWQHIEPSDNVWDFTDVDSWVDTHYKAGRDLVFTLFGTPAWASARPTEEGIYGPYNLGLQAEPDPTKMDRWDRFCAKVAARYVGKIKYYEVWNEPNYNNDGAAPTHATHFFYSGTFAKLSEMTRRANQAIKDVDPTAKIIAPSMTNWSALAEQATETYMVSMLGTATGDESTTMKDWVDILNVHLYTSGNGITYIPLYIDRINAAVTTAGVTDKEVWDTESSPFAPEIISMSPHKANLYIARFLLVIASLGIARTIYYQYDNPTMGLNISDSMGIREQVISMLTNGSIQSSHILNDGRVACYTNTGLIII